MIVLELRWRLQTPPSYDNRKGHCGGTTPERRGGTETIHQETG